MMAQRQNLTDRAKRYRAQNNVTGPRKCVLCGSRSDIQVMHLSGNENDGERANLAYGCRSCNGKLSAAFKKIGAGRRTAQYNPAAGIPTYEQYKWGVSHHNRGEHDEGGAIIHATPKHKRIQYAKMIAREAGPARRETAAQRRRDFDERWNAGFLDSFSSSKHYTRSGSGKFKDVAQHEDVKAAKRASAEEEKLAKREAAEEKRRADRLNKEFLRKLAADRREKQRLEREEIQDEKRRIREEEAMKPKIVSRHRGYSISRTADGDYFSSLDPQSLFETKRGATSLIDSYLKGRGNPASYRGMSVAKLEQIRPHVAVLTVSDDWLERDRGRRELAKVDRALELARKRESRNPSKFDRCVKGVKAKGGAGNAYAVCTAAGTRNNPTIRQLLRKLGLPISQADNFDFRSPADKERFKRELQAKLAEEKRDQAERRSALKRRNPADASAKVFEEFHGYQPAEVVTVTKKVFYHAHLAAAGKLTFLQVWGIDDQGHTIKGFKGTLLAFNEDKNQLFAEGGDQQIDLADYGIDKPHELETLGKIVDIGYFGKKTHLGDEGGTAVYVHKFRSTNQNGRHVVVKIARYPDLIYDVRNAQLLFSGGSYEILAEGINK